MRTLKILYLVLGLALLALVLAEVDVIQVMARARQVGWGMAIVLALYFAAFAIDSFTWQLALLEVPLDGTWAYRTWKVRMVGEVFNSIIPAGGMGGEPVKAVLLKRYYDVGYRAGTASLILAKTINLMALVAFLAVGFALMQASPALPASYKAVGGAGLLALGIGTGLFYVVQRYRLTTVTGTWLSRWPALGRLDSVLHHVRDMDDRLVAFYAGNRGRLAAAVVLAFVNWVLGAAEIYVTMRFLDHPVTWIDAWIIEAAAQLVRAGAFFIPAGIGAQEGVFLLVCAAMTGSPVLGVAVALVRRFREVLWIVWGVALGGMFSLRAGRRPAPPEADGPPAAEG